MPVSTHWPAPTPSRLRGVRHPPVVPGILQSVVVCIATQLLTLLHVTFAVSTTTPSSPRLTPCRCPRPRTLRIRVHIARTECAESPHPPRQSPKRHPPPRLPPRQPPSAPLPVSRPVAAVASLRAALPPHTRRSLPAPCVTAPHPPPSPRACRRLHAPCVSTPRTLRLPMPLRVPLAPTVSVPSVPGNRVGPVSPRTRNLACIRALRLACPLAASFHRTPASVSPCPPSPPHTARFHRTPASVFPVPAVASPRHVFPPRTHLRLPRARRRLPAPCVSTPHLPPSQPCPPSPPRALRYRPTPAVSPPCPLFPPSTRSLHVRCVSTPRPLRVLCLGPHRPCPPHTQPGTPTREAGTQHPQSVDELPPPALDTDDDGDEGQDECEPPRERPPTPMPLPLAAPVPPTPPIVIPALQTPVGGGRAAFPPPGTLVVVQGVVFRTHHRRPPTPVLVRACPRSRHRPQCECEWGVTAWASAAAASTSSRPSLPSPPKPPPHPSSPAPPMPPAPSGSSNNAASTNTGRRTPWTTLRERLGVPPSSSPSSLSPNSTFTPTSSPSPAEPLDERAVMLAEVACAFNMGLRLGVPARGGRARARLTNTTNNTNNNTPTADDKMGGRMRAAKAGVSQSVLFPAISDPCPPPSPHRHLRAPAPAPSISLRPEPSRLEHRLRHFPPAYGSIIDLNLTSSLPSWHIPSRLCFSLILDGLLQEFGSGVTLQWFASPISFGKHFQ
ncbi:hypothetical protein B0H11DRAFT_2231004 [Mycena galericulata]|nr:hypothetical protein B0H11DRAFT_2231004 [Mycena galericulata]